MNKLFSMSVLILVALIAFHQPCVLAQDAAIDETIASILNDVEAEPIPAIATEPVADVETATDEEAPIVEAMAETVDEDAVATDPVNADASVIAVLDDADGAAPTATEMAAPVAGEMVKFESPIRAINNGSPSPSSDAAGAVRISIDFEQSPLPEVIRAFRDASGANIISGWTNTTPHLVSARLDDVDWRVGLSAIVASYGLELKEEPRGSSIYTIREKITDTAELPLFTEAFELKHAKAAEISNIFRDILGLSDSNKTAQAMTATRSKSITAPFSSANIVVVKATEEELAGCREIVAKLDVPTRQVYIEARFVRLSSSASKKLGMKWDSLGNFGASISGLKGGIQVSETKLTPLDYTATSANRSSMISATGSKRDFGYTETKTTGTLIPDSYAIPGATIAGLTSDDLSWKKASAFGGVLSITDFGLAMSAFEQTDGAQIFSNPKIIVQNETTAKVDMTTKEPNVKVEVTSGTTDSPGDKITSSLEKIPGEKEPWVGEAFFSYGITLEVTPRISPAGLITVEIVPSISSLDRYRTMSDGNMYPIISMQSLDTTFTMGDGKTAVIGGLTETTEGNTDSGIPLLRSIPWIGPRLFGWKSRNKEQYEIIVFVSVGVIDGNDIAEDAGMPKNAVIGRGLLDGSMKEPGDRTEEEMFSLEQKQGRSYRIK